MSKSSEDKVDVENINTPGKTSRVGAVKYWAVREAMLAAMTKDAPGNTFAEIKAATLPGLPDGMFPGGDKLGWWMKSVQLDLEAKAIIKRADTKPLRFFLT